MYGLGFVFSLSSGVRPSVLGTRECRFFPAGCPVISVGVHAFTCTGVNCNSTWLFGRIWLFYALLTLPLRAPRAVLACYLHCGAVGFRGRRGALSAGHFTVTVAVTLIIILSKYSAGGGAATAHTCRSVYAGCGIKFGTSGTCGRNVGTVGAGGSSSFAGGVPLFYVDGRDGASTTASRVRHAVRGYHGTVGGRSVAGHPGHSGGE